MIKNIARLKIPILVLPEIYVTNPTTRGPNNAANLPNILYIPKNSEDLWAGTRLAKYDLLKAWMPPCANPISDAMI